MKIKKQFRRIKDKNSFQVLCDEKSIKRVELDNGAYGVEIQGYASTKDKDRVDDVVQPEAFKSALDLYMLNPILLLQHKHDKPIGKITEATIDDKGLFIKGLIVQDTDGVMNLVEQGVLKTFSIGYREIENETKAEEKDDGSVEYTNVIKNLELYEISLVSVPANPYALAKSLNDCFELEDVKEAEEEEEGEEGTVIEGESTIEHGEEVVEETEDNTDENLEPENHKTEEPKEEGKGAEEVEEKEEETTEEVVDEEKEETVENEATETVEPTETEQKEEVKENEEEVEEVETEEKEVEEEKEEEEVSEDAESSKDKQEAENVEEDATQTVKSMAEVEEKELSHTKELESLRNEVKELKEFLNQVSENEKSIKELKDENHKLKELLKGVIKSMVEIDTAVQSTVVKSGFQYSKVQRQSPISNQLKGVIDQLYK